MSFSIKLQEINLNVCEERKIFQFFIALGLQKTDFC